MTTTTAPSTNSGSSAASSATPTRRRRLAPRGMEETLTLTRLGVSGNLTRTLECTNPIWVLSSSPAGSAIQVGSCRWQTLTLNPIGAERLSLTRVVGSRHPHAGTGSLA
jgi:hypothetical protein